MAILPDPVVVVIAVMMNVDPSICFAMRNNVSIYCRTSTFAQALTCVNSGDRRVRPMVTSGVAGTSDHGRDKNRSRPGFRDRFFEVFEPLVFLTFALLAPALALIAAVLAQGRSIASW
jgi:hypothetical protein